MKIQFAFFWIGQDTNVPANLVKSIRHIYGNEAIIYMLTNLNTDKINDVDYVIQSHLPQSIMLARLKAYSLLKTDKPTFYIDADSLIIDKITIPPFNNNIAFLIHRNLETVFIKPSFPEFYPEFVGKTFVEMMPILFGLIITAKGEILFKELLKIAESMPERFHRWYGDQMAIAKLWNENKEKFLLLNQTEYLYITKTSISEIDLESLRKNKTKIITFKGMTSKKFISDTLENLINITSN